MTIIVLSVHYKYPDLLRDQWRRICDCAGPARRSLNAEICYHPVVHGGSDRTVVEAASAVGGRGGVCCSCIHLDGKPTSTASAHGDSLAEAMLNLTRRGSIGDEDLIAVMDHDAHPVDADLFAASGKHLLGRTSLGGVGIPQWHRGHCYLHPSFLIARSRLIRQMGPETAFKARMAPGSSPSFWDVCEGFTIWCADNGWDTLPLRVNATRFPWSRWDSDMVPGGGAEFVGAHGEPVRVGNLMHYGLTAERSLVSHVWAAPLERRRTVSRLRRWLATGKSGLARQYDEREVLSAYLADACVTRVMTPG